MAREMRTMIIGFEHGAVTHVSVETSANTAHYGYQVQSTGPNADINAELEAIFGADVWAAIRATHPEPPPEDE